MRTVGRMGRICPSDATLRVVGLCHARIRGGSSPVSNHDHACQHNAEDQSNVAAVIPPIHRGGEPSRGMAEFHWISGGSQCGERPRPRRRRSGDNKLKLAAAAAAAVVRCNSSYHSLATSFELPNYTPAIGGVCIDLSVGKEGKRSLWARSCAVHNMISPIATKHGIPLIYFAPSPFGDRFLRGWNPVAESHRSTG